jgi:hypothetical protein
VALNLRRGRIEYDRGLTYLRGRHWKGARDATGAALAEGAERVDLWVVVAPVGAAIGVLERLHSGALLFANTLPTNGRAEGCLQTRVGLGRIDQLLTKDTAALISSINAYCAANGRDDAVPADLGRRPLLVTLVRRAGRGRRSALWLIRPFPLVVGMRGGLSGLGSYVFYTVQRA